METVEAADVHTPLETVHTNEFVPVPRAVAWEEELFTDVIFPGPAITDQAPVPTVGIIAASVAVVAQIV
jgi:hypothetical protein